MGGASVPRPLPTYKQALAWLYGLERFGIKLGLENIRRLLDELSRRGDLQIALGGWKAAAPWKVIHVAGTNGKGSVCAMIDSICRAQGYRTGVFISPHLVTFRERIRVNGETISENAVADGLTTIRNLVADWDPPPTFFEVTTALAVKHFSDAKLDVAILETGLGGRLDATNAIQSDVSVITPIGFDHEEWLGNTLAEIAGEKAGIIKPRVPVISAPQQREAEEVIRARATECGSPVHFVNETYHKSPVALRGEYQKRNAALAIAAIQAVNIELSEKGVVRGLAAVEWPARFQKWDERTIIDGAHNPAAARVLAQTWREAFGNQKATLVLAVLSDKDLRGIGEALAPIAASVILPKIRSERAVAPAELGKVLTSIFVACRAGASPAGNRSGCPTISITQTIAEALRIARAKPSPILITGSLHFAGEVLADLRGEPAAFEECAQ
ncbi:MAG TPA: folylpolyglutamate synthase/dihydrofolate synthase family protein [Candidatus Udaeobacter sp.]|nr:folylpolyglutamate synthase/dihydrofolate synthase family protein [Candidatus Udaeobacter sp.]